MKMRSRFAVVAGILTTLTASGCMSNVAFERSAQRAAPVVRADTVATLAAAAKAESDRADRYHRNLQRCRFEMPGRPDRMLNRPASDPVIAACLARAEG